jgi:cytosol alanyl aminopeptidase
MVGAMNFRRWMVLVLAACGSNHVAPAPLPTPPVAARMAPPPPTPPDLRLPTNVKPTHNTVDLTIDPATTDFTGTITTAIDVSDATDVIWLDGEEIAISSAVIKQDDEMTAIASYPKKGYVGLSLPHALHKGTGTMTIKYAGKMHKDDGDGIYTVNEANDWYAFTQFESTAARQAFPTFDEPSFKIPWQLTIHTKQALSVFSNTLGTETTANGIKTVVFAETKPLPSYLVAFAIGPFDTLDAGKSKSGTPIRVVVPKGRAGDAGYPAKVTAALLDKLEDYFGTPYPFPKLDLVAVPVFNAGAMENPGLITFRQAYLLTKPEELTEGKQIAYATTAAHEMAHQWFGDLVTLAWWDDTWLNESFASWMEAKIVEGWKPEWDLDVDAVAEKSGVMAQDSLDSARSIRQPVVAQGDIDSSFDGITYQKGEAVLRMLERTIGPDVWQKGVRAYLAKHAWGNATYDDFVSSMSAAAGNDLHAMFDAFVKQSGLPLVAFELSCAKGAAPKLAMTQSRYAPTGSKIDPKRTWAVPVCVRWGVGAATGRDCTTLDAPSGELALTAKSCPDWVLPNEGEVGYYRPSIKGKMLDDLVKHQKALTLAERVGLIGDISALVQNATINNAVALGLVAELAKDKSRHIVDSSIAIVGGIDEMVPDALRPNYERFIRKLYLARARELGWHSKPGEGPDAKQLRPELLSLVAGDGKDQPLIDEATKLAWKWFDDHKAVDPELVGTVLATAARYGDQNLFDRVLAEAKKATDRQERGRFLRALGSFRDPKLVEQALAVVLTDAFEVRETSGILQGQLGDPRSRMVAYKFVEKHFDEILAKLPVMYRPYMAFMAVALCDEAQKPAVEAFLKPKIEPLDGGPHALQQAMESMSVCAAERKAQTPGVEAFLKRQ